MGLSVASKASLQHQKEGQATPYSRQQSVPLMLRSGTHRYRNPQMDFNKQSSALGAAFGMVDLGGAGGDAAAADYVNVAAKTLDMDEIDKETLHLLVFLFMQFLSTPEQVSQSFLGQAFILRRAHVDR